VSATVPATDGRDVARRLDDVRRRIAAAGADPDGLTILAVTKGFGPDAVRAAVAAGVSDVGESYAQELRAKADALGPDAAGVRWHFVGRLQSNKIRGLRHHVFLWHSIDRSSVADELARRSPGARCLVQVNVSGEPQQGGCLPDDAPALVEEAQRAGLDVRGLMAVGRAGGPEAARPGFRQIRQMADALGLDERSMGMSDDLEAAVAEGATIVRVGRALFGPRPGPAVLRN
jgi:PLP dependent protein